MGQDRDFVGVLLLAIFVSELGWLAAEMLDQLDDEGAGAGGRVEDLDIPIDQLSAEILIKSTFRMSRSAAAGSHAAGTPGHAPGGVLAVVCLDNLRDNTRGKALWTSLPSLGPQEECPWRLSDVIPARMVSHTLRTWTCSHLTSRGQSSRPPAVSPSRVRPTAVSAIGTMRRAANTPFSSPEARWRSGSAMGPPGGSALETPSCSKTSRDKGTPAGAS